MPTHSAVIGQILDTVPVPAFIALQNGNIVYANRSLLTVAGQPALVDMERTVFGLGIFHNPAEYRGFIQSFKHGGSTRRLILPAGRLKNDRRTLVLHASQVSYDGQSGLCGIVNRTPVDEESLHDEQDGLTASVLDKVAAYTMRIDSSGSPTFMNLPLLIELGFPVGTPRPA